MVLRADKRISYYSAEPRPGEFVQPNGIILLSGRVLLRRVTFPDAINGLEIERFSPNIVYALHCMSASSQQLWIKAIVSVISGKRVDDPSKQQQQPPLSPKMGQPPPPLPRRSASTNANT